jgi:hypothetical protein
MNKKLIKAAVIGALFSVAPMSFAADEVEDIKAPSMLDEFSFSANVGFIQIIYSVVTHKHRMSLQFKVDLT